MTNNTNGIETLLELDKELTAVFNHIKNEQSRNKNIFGKMKLAAKSWPEDFNLTPIEQ